MCRHQTLFYDDSTGYVIQCEECGNFQVGFGNLLVTLNEKDFSSFRKSVNKTLLVYGDSVETITKSFFLPTPSEGVKLLLNKNELQLLATMLEEADTEHKAQQLLHLFYK
ncbi:DUF6686 family protein [Foetidibacter luteolus]|uniref:DUF6686 family protein n=1 Tax=Foetidibacter luteolus TaxID=2608880 RepID=UPI00129A7C96|nr:DUF6686 family protein [Foetidibacter luteolus]